MKGAQCVRSSGPPGPSPARDPSKNTYTHGFGLLFAAALSVGVSLSLSGCTMTISSMTSTSQDYGTKTCEMKVQDQENQNSLVEVTLHCSGTRSDLLQLHSETEAAGKTRAGGRNLKKGPTGDVETHPISDKEVLVGCRVKEAGDVKCPLGQELDQEAMKTFQVECRTESNSEIRGLCTEAKGKEAKEGSLSSDYVADETMHGVSLLRRLFHRPGHGGSKVGSLTLNSDSVSLANFFQGKA